MYIVTFIVSIVLFLAAASWFCYGLIQLHRNNQQARTTMGTGFIIALVAVILAAILFGGFSV